MWSAATLLLCSIAAGVTLLGLRRIARNRARQRALARPFPPAWDAMLLETFPPYARLSDPLRRELQQTIKEFLFEKRFEGCGGQTIDDEVRVLVAAQACLLLLNRHVRCYPRLRTVLIYPSTYIAREKGLFGTADEDNLPVRLGESWNHGAVVLAWDSVKRGTLNFDDGHNVAMHEFAHQLDQEDGAADGAPVLPRAAYKSWARVLSTEYERLRQLSGVGRPTVMDEYGATNPAEFFAVATETFFEKPRQLHGRHPELYAELKSFYHLDPLEWERPAGPKIRIGQHAQPDIVDH